MDVLAVREVTLRALNRARSGEGPTLIEALTYRFRGHSLADPDELRSVAEKEAWVAKDPIFRLYNYILDNQIATASSLESIKSRVQDVVHEAIDFALSSPEPSTDELKKYLFAD